MALLEALAAGHDVRYLITMAPVRSDSWMFHRPCIELTKLQADAIGIKQLMRQTGGEKEKELDDLQQAIASIADGIDGVVSGAVKSSYQKSRIDAICKKLGLKSIAPLWGMDEEELLNEEVAELEIVITAVATAGMDESWLGRMLDRRAIEDLKRLHKTYNINISAEGGEYETLVLDAPFFRKRLRLVNIKKIWNDATSSGYIEAEGKLVEKR